MKRQAAILAAVLAGLVIWDGRLSRRQAESRRAHILIQRLVSPDLFRDRPIAAFQLEYPDGKSYFFAHQRGVWRCLSERGAIALTPRVRSLLGKIIEAHGVVQSHVAEYSANLRSFGLDSKDRLRIALCGPAARAASGGDVIFALDVGKPVPTTGGTYVHPVNEPQIWSVDASLADEFERDPQNGLPRLIDPGLIPAVWPGSQSGLRRIVVERSGKPALDMVRRDKKRTEAEERIGLPPWDWIIQESGSEKAADPRQANFYSQFLLRAPYAAILPAQQRKELGLEKPSIRLRLESTDGATLELGMGDRTARGHTAVLNTFSECLFEVAPEIVAKMLPEPGLLLDAKAGNPWEEWFQR